MISSYLHNINEVLRFTFDARNGNVASSVTPVRAVVRAVIRTATLTSTLSTLCWICQRVFKHPITNLNVRMADPERPWRASLPCGCCYCESVRRTRFRIAHTNHFWLPPLTRIGCTRMKVCSLKESRLQALFQEDGCR